LEQVVNKDLSDREDRRVLNRIQDSEVTDLGVDSDLAPLPVLKLQSTDRPDLEVPGHLENMYREDWEVRDVKVDPVVLAVSDHLKNTDLASSENKDLALDRVGPVLDHLENTRLVKKKLADLVVSTDQAVSMGSAVSMDQAVSLDPVDSMDQVVSLDLVASMDLDVDLETAELLNSCQDVDLEVADLVNSFPVVELVAADLVLVKLGEIAKRRTGTPLGVKVRLT